MAKPFVITALSENKIPLVNRFYQQQNSPHRAGRHETVLVVYKGNETIIAAVRIKLVAKDKLITGLLVSPKYRGQGLGQQLIIALCDHQQTDPRPLFAFIEAKLLPLYQQCGFEHIAQQQLPSLLLRNFEALNGNKKRHQAMFIEVN